jgi:predicted GH43/DUF377 family glycosyl hydrolase
MFIQRFLKNPILKPDKNNSWEAEAVLNCSPAIYNHKIFILYRAISLPHYHQSINQSISISDIGIAESKDGINFSNRKKFISPEYSWEQFGCEDPRVTKFNDKYYIFYTALSNWPPKPEDIKIGLAITKDFKKIESKHLVTNFNSKAMALFPEKINGKIWAILTINTDKPPAEICLVSFDKIEDIWSEEFWNKWYANFNKNILNLKRSNGDHIEVGSAPIKTKYGWLVFYSYIQNYFSNNRVYGIEAFLLDLKNPQKIIGKTDFPLLWPEEYYEKYGLVYNTIFPSGALIKKDKVYLYYGSADTACSLAIIDLKTLVSKFLKKEIKFLKAERFKANPIIEPNSLIEWQSQAAFNPGAVYLKNKFHIVYRAMSSNNTSVFGYAVSKDGFKIDFQSKDPIYVPRADFEMKKKEGANSGVEDPRLVLMNDKIYMFYTAYDGINSPRIALSSIKVSDFLNQNWSSWSWPVLISPPDIDDKDAAMFPQKIGGYYVIIHRVGKDMDLSFHKNLNFDGKNFLEEYRWLKPRPGYWDSEKIGLAGPPLKTKYGWIVFYHGFDLNKTYKIGAILTDLKDPKKIIARTDYPILEPEKDYEKNGLVNNVVFPCSNVLVKDKIYFYYGGADKVIGVATLNLKDLINVLKQCRI